jgi:hypothetical protein
MKKVITLSENELIDLIKRVIGDKFKISKKDEPIEKKYGEEIGKRYIAIGDSQTPAIANNSKFDLVSGQESKESLWKVGEGIGWLIDAVEKFPKSTDVEGVVISIGTNGGFSKNYSQAEGLMNALEKTFPNATFIFVPGSWGWGNLKGKEYTKEKTPKKVEDFYNQFESLGARVTNTAIGYSEKHPGGSTKSFKTIGNEIDGMI